MPLMESYGKVPSGLALQRASRESLNEHHQQLTLILSHHWPLEPSQMPAFWQRSAHALDNEFKRRGTQLELFPASR
jgi:hypothetical protein